MLRTAGYFLLGVLCLLVGAELLLRLLPVSTATATGYYIDPLIRTSPPGYTIKAATGWDLRNAQTLRTNNFGFVADRDFVRDDRAVALIGDSFVEAAMLPAEDRPGAQLERDLPSRPVYAMGSPGTNLLDYAESIRVASQKLGVRDFVVMLERFDVRQAFCGSGNVAAVCLDQDTLAAKTVTKPQPGTIKQILRHSALAQYAFSQLKLDPSRLVAQIVKQARPDGPDASHAPAAPAAPRDDPQKLAVVIKTFFERIRPYRGGRLVMVLDSDRGTLAAEKAQTLDPGRAQFIAAARAEGAIVIDTEPLFLEHFARSELKLDVGPYDGHLNPLGIAIAMQAAAKALRAR